MALTPSPLKILDGRAPPPGVYNLKGYALESETGRAILDRVARTAADRGLIRTGDRIVAAVSGGCDSVAMVLVLLALRERRRFDLGVAHVNHCLRDGAEADSEFVRELARGMGLRCKTCTVDVGACRLAGESLEMAARRERYRALRAVADEWSASAVATGHTLDDQAETMLLKLVRGARPGGLRGIEYEVELDGLRVIRPLRDCHRHELRAALAAEHGSWREDESNDDTAFLRNRIRHEVLPSLVRQLGDALPDTLIRLGDRLAEDERYLQSLAGDALRAAVDEDNGALRVAALGDSPPALQPRMIMGWLRAHAEVEDHEITADLIERIVEVCAGEQGTRQIPISADLVVERRYNRLMVLAATGQDVSFRVSLRVPGVTEIPGLPLRVDVVEGRGAGIKPTRALGRWPAHGSLGRSRVGDSALILRNWEAGDRMRPLGLGGTVKVHDIFVNEKVPRSLRATYPVLECGGEIVWIPGYAVAEGWEVPGEAEPALALSLEKHGLATDHFMA